MVKFKQIQMIQITTKKINLRKLTNVFLIFLNIIMSLFFIENIANNDIISFQKIGPEVDLIKMEIKINDLIEYRNKLLAKRDRNTPKHVK